ncbi:MAG: nucleotidyltransferase domain-containing protein [Saccharofermentans sp.]|nr:nucleotidyltransferase domain-containing protein [Saccharofermentans sp.]
MYSLAKQTDVPYTTINRLVNERLSINNCNAGAVFKIAAALGVRVEDLMNNEQVYTLEEIARLIAPVAKKYNIPKVYIFGSYARGEATADSDVDLMIEVGDLHGLEVIGALEDFKNVLKKPVDMITTRSLNQDRTQKYSKIFIDNLEKEKIMIYG